METAVYYSNRIFLPDERYLHSKSRTFTNRAFYFYLSLMSIDNGLHVAESKTKSFYVMDIASMCTIKFLKYPFQCFLTHANSIIFYPDYYVLICVVGTDTEKQVLL